MFIMDVKAIENYFKILSINKESNIDEIIDRINKITELDDPEYEKYLLYNSIEELEKDTILRYKRYIISINDWKTEVHLIDKIKNYIKTPSLDKKVIIDNFLIKYIESD